MASAALLMDQALPRLWGPVCCTLPPLPCRLPFPGSSDCWLHAGLSQWEVLKGGGKVVGGRFFSSLYALSSVSSSGFVFSMDSASCQTGLPCSQLLPDHLVMGHWKPHVFLRRLLPLGAKWLPAVPSTWVPLWSHWTS